MLLIPIFTKAIIDKKYKNFRNINYINNKAINKKIFMENLMALI
jgi:hypothetical protein